jgi:hypothetical protein
MIDVVRRIAVGSEEQETTHARRSPSSRLSSRTAATAVTVRKMR